MLDILPFWESFHKRFFVLAGEAFYDFAFCFLPRLPLFPAQRCIAFFLPSTCSCFSMPSASRYLCIGATEPFGWDWPRVFFCRVWGTGARQWSGALRLCHSR